MTKGPGPDRNGKDIFVHLPISIQKPAEPGTAVYRVPSRKEYRRTA
jgi:hypothetical protein